MVSVIVVSSSDTSTISIFTAIGVVIPLYIGTNANCVTDILEGVIGVPSK